MSNAKELFKLGGDDSGLSKTTKIVITVSGLLFIAIVWQTVCSLGLIPEKILPAPLTVLASYKPLITEYDMFANAW